jgi:YHS domain-containing protein
MILRLLQFLVVLAILRALWRLFKGILEGAGYVRIDDLHARSARPAANTKLARDPVCGTFVSPAKAPAIRVSGETLYFCSDKCRRDFERSARP